MRSEPRRWGVLLLVTAMLVGFVAAVVLIAPSSRDSRQASLVSGEVLRASCAAPCTIDALLNASPDRDGSVGIGREPTQRPWMPSSENSVAVARFAYAAKTADHVLPIGPGSEKAWNVLTRVDSKGAPLPGYKGGSIFKSTEGRLVQKEGVTYRQWDVNPYTKGVDRGPERIVTGSDGSAYWTGDHYDTFLMFRGPTG